MDKISQILDKVKRQIRPKGDFQVDGMVERISNLLKKNRLEADCVPGGSFAKGTILKDDFDIDLFVRFNVKYRNQDISELLGNTIESLSPERLHGSRDYFQIKTDGIIYEVIPVLDINSYKQADNVTDMSPLHVEYVLSKSKKMRNLGDEVRLAKQFAKAAKVYGAESYIRGFSGHMMDLLVIYYGSFEQLVMQASIWGEKVIIDIEKHLKDPVAQLNKAKTSSPIILVDPIQPDRNAAAAISEEKFKTFKKVAKEFIESPSEEFFIVKSLDPTQVKKRWPVSEIVSINAKPLDGKDDVVGAKMLKVYEHILMKIEENQFEMLESGWEFGETSILYFVIKKGDLPSKIELMGPPTSQKGNSDKFRKAHKEVEERKGRLYAIEKRKYTNILNLIKDLIKSPYIKERVKKISC